MGQDLVKFSKDVFLSRARSATKCVAHLGPSRLNKIKTDLLRPLPLDELAAHDWNIMTLASLSLVAELERIAAALETDAESATKISLPGIAERIAKHVGVRHDEVAIMGLSVRWRHLHFLVPESLKQVGFIPLSSTTAIAAKTARESRPDIINNFASVRHATVFEGVKIGGEAGDIIQKMISAPILYGEKVVGVIQISRKGSDAGVAGPDFTADDLGRILALCKPLGKIVQHVAGE